MLSMTSFLKLLGLLTVFFLLVACGKDSAEKEINMILLNTADIDLKAVKIERGRTAGTPDEKIGKRRLFQFCKNRIRGFSSWCF
jgi:hypothetical protein